MYLIVGASGYLGSYFVKNISENTQKSVIATYCSTKPNFSHPRVKWLSVDITNKNDVVNLIKVVQEYKSLNVIYLSAYHHPDKVEENPDLAWSINVNALDFFLQSIKPYAQNFIYASTDCVYGESEVEIDPTPAFICVDPAYFATSRTSSTRCLVSPMS